MPQKRNPDAAELIRGKTGRVLGDFVALATVVKGLVLTYGTDLQEDKERVFDAADTLELSLAAMAAMIADLTADPDKMRAAAEAGYPTATDLADWLVRVLKKPFREAHHIAGSHRQAGGGQGRRRWTSCRWPRCRRSNPASPRTCSRFCRWKLRVNSRMSLGGTAPARVREQICVLAGETEMKKLLLIIALASLLLASCGVKNDLVKPDGTATPQGPARSLASRRIPSAGSQPMNYFSL